MIDAAYDRDWRGRAERAEAEVVRLRALLTRAGEMMGQVPAGQVRGMFALLGEIDRATLEVGAGPASE